MGQRRCNRAGAAGLAFVLCVLSVFAPGAVAAQEFGLPASTILVLDPNRLFTETAFGKRAKHDLDDRSRALAAENRRIEAELAAEEQALTDERPGMDPEAFRAKADAFDAKVQRIRVEQEAKAVKLSEETGNAQRRFLAVAQPVLQELMRDTGAAVLLDRRSAILSTNAIDVTDEAVRRIDASIGDGTGIKAPAVPGGPAPAPDSPQE